VFFVRENAKPYYSLKHQGLVQTNPSVSSVVKNLICVHLRNLRIRTPHSLVPQSSKTGANEYWSQTIQVQIKQNAIEFSENASLRSEGSSGSGAWTHACTGPGLHPTGGTTEELRRIQKNRTMGEKPNVKLAYGEKKYHH
jgi:hypothetical protein